MIGGSKENHGETHLFCIYFKRKRRASK